MTFSKLKKRWLSFWRTKTGKRISKTLQYVFIAIVIGYLIYQLTEIGWQRVWESLPVTPWFYVLFLFLYFALPVSEQFIYGTSLNFSFKKGLPVFIQKKIYNADVLGYSGEAYFFIWAKKNLKESSGYIFGVIKDNNIISSVTSTLVAAVLLSIFLYVSQLNLQQIIEVNREYFYYGAIAVVLILASLIYFRHYIITMSSGMASKIFGIHLARLLFVYSVEIIQWMVVMPEVPLYIWFTYMGIKIISTRIPFLPSRDLLFIGASLEISQFLNISGAGIAGILLASNVLTKLMNLGLYSFLAFKGSLIKKEETDSTQKATS
ncbi:hypothetical protein CK503_01025 [Aliifodinibius salipaludis]|uniref:Flippase-like domain-containing protein n=1 Tax=Fodinibius salipaludis TaxID=2032627 RepID=A0A2A2GFP0_9BACT|nr:hypothetical protein CK503_01025 [Aliifodinibius salipaludis]